jgi:DNA integrity scanning protein DisA with diadenylate cyclase activity
MNKLQSKKLLHDYLVNNNHLKGTYEYLGTGSNGHAYKLNNGLVIKITQDLNEVYAAESLKEKNLDFVVTYHNIETIFDIGYIVMDYVKPLNAIIDKKIIDNWYDIKESMRKNMEDYNLDIEEIHWGNCGIYNGELMFFDLK